MCACIGVCVCVCVCVCHLEEGHLDLVTREPGQQLLPVLHAQPRQRPVRHHRPAAAGTARFATAAGAAGTARFAAVLPASGMAGRPVCSRFRSPVRSRFRRRAERPAAQFAAVFAAQFAAVFAGERNGRPVKNGRRYSSTYTAVSSAVSCRRRYRAGSFCWRYRAGSWCCCYRVSGTAPPPGGIPEPSPPPSPPASETEPRTVRPAGRPETTVVIPKPRSPSFRNLARGRRPDLGRVSQTPDLAL